MLNFFDSDPSVLLKLMPLPPKEQEQYMFASKEQAEHIAEACNGTHDGFNAVRLGEFGLMRLIRVPVEMCKVGDSCVITSS